MQATTEIVGVLYENRTFDMSAINNTEFKGCEFKGCSFVGVEFDATYFDRCVCIRCDFTGAIFKGAVVRSEFINCKFEWARMSVPFDKCRFDESTFMKTILSEASFYESVLKFCMFDGVELRKVSLLKSMVAYGRIRDADCTDLEIIESMVIDCRFQDANLQKSCWSGSEIKRCRFKGVDLSEARYLNSHFDYCTGLDDVIIQGMTRSDGYRFYLVNDGGRVSVRAGCRNFNIIEALEYWGGEDYYDEVIGRETVIILNGLLAMAKHRGWE